MSVSITFTEQRPLPDWPTVHRELKRPRVTLQLLWEEYRGRHPQGYGYSRFCELYRVWTKRLSPTMRQTHIACERLFVDYAGTKLQVFDASAADRCLIAPASSLTHHFQPIHGGRS